MLYAGCTNNAFYKYIYIHVIQVQLTHASERSKCFESLVINTKNIQNAYMYVMIHRNTDLKIKEIKT